MNNFYQRFLLVSMMVFMMATKLLATGEPSTYFNIFVPPNNNAVQRNVCLVVTAISDSTTFEIIDDGMDGDSDDCKTGLLMAGQSYILYLKDNGINDDALYASGGVLKRDGDYFIIKSNKNMYASQSTNSDWQHDWVPGVSQSSLSQKFIIYATVGSDSKRDLNVFTYEDSTYVTLRKISRTPTIQSGYTNIDTTGGTIIFQKMINRGQDLIHYYTNARNIMNNGETYVVETSKPCTVQYGALFGNERDGGGYVPTNTGSCSGSLAYFTVPYQSGGEQEIRVVSWDASNSVKLYRYSAGSWILMKDWSMGQKTFQEWVGKSNGNVSYPTVFKIECTSGKRVSIFEGNWFETGSPGTSDMATMMSAENGTTSGNYFIAYMAPPGDEANVYNPFTKSFFGGRYTHLYVFSQDTAHVVIKDAFTGGSDFIRNYTILPGRYVDCALSENEWKSIYNGNGSSSSGAKRPYLIVTSDNNVSVMNTNFNDNWMMYFGSSQKQSFRQNTTSSASTVIPGQTFTVSSKVEIDGTSSVRDVKAELEIEGGLKVQKSTFNDTKNKNSYEGSIDTSSAVVKVSFKQLPDLAPTGDYNITTEFKGSVMDAEGKSIPNNSVSAVTTQISGTVNGKPQQSTSIESVALNSYNGSNLMYSFSENTGLDNTLTDSWTVSNIDYDNDGDEDLFFTDCNATKPNQLFKNTGNGIFVPVTTGAIVTDVAKSMTSSWADYDNDGDLDVLVANNTGKPCFFYINNGNGTFAKNTSAPFTQKVGYYHHASWVDVNNDGQLELYLGNYWPTRLNELWRLVDGNWNLWEDNLLSQIAGTATGITWADYDNDGYQDLLVLNNELGKNRMYHNKGSGEFEVVTNAITNHGGYSVGSAWGDIDNDGDLDLFISNASNRNNELYFNKGNNIFELVTSGSIVNDKGHSHGAVFGDLDKDGDIDLYVSNDQGLKFLYLNDGTGIFTSKSEEWPVSNFGKSYSASLSDIDTDGDLDIVSATHSNQRNYIFSANNNSNKWIGIRCVGTKSNKCAVGTRVRVKAGGKWQSREINTQNGFGGQSGFRQMFGLGSVAIIDSIEVKWPSGLIQFSDSVNVNQNIVFTEANSTQIKARAYSDNNGNCLFDNGDELIPNMKFGFNNEKVVGYTNSKGELSVNLGVGSYTMKVGNSQFASVCGNTDTFSIRTVNSNLDLKDFAFKPTCTYPDLSISASTTIMRNGFKANYVVELNNKGVGTATNSSFKVTFPKGVTPLSANLEWDSLIVEGDKKTVYWKLGSVDYGYNAVYNILYQVSASMKPGDAVSCLFAIGSSGNDCNSSDNIITDYQSIYGSIDPNDILAYPEGEGEEHFISNTQEMTYRIRFQNVGNYAAEMVAISDEIPEGLDVSTIKNIVSSHPYQLSYEGRRLYFTFPDIHLPDSGTNMELSNGYIQFTVAQMEGNKGGKILPNIASIQFDFNEPLLTNKVFQTVFIEPEVKKENELIVFPNPSNGTKAITLKSATANDKAITQISIENSEGMVVLVQQMNEIMPQITLNNLSAGFYMITAIDEAGATYRGKLIIVK